MLTAGVLAALAGCASAAPMAAEAGYRIPADPGSLRLVWADEFDGPGPDAKKWRYETGNGFTVDGQYIANWGTGELEYFRESPDNVSQDGGILSLTARKEACTDGAGTPFEYTSGKLSTRGLFSFRYGRIEVRARCPSGKGFWPAVWMLPAGGKNINSGKYGLWAASGEVDIFEGRGSRIQEATGAIHYGGQWPDNTNQNGAYLLEGDGGISDFHVYTMDWEDGRFTWYVDGTEYFSAEEWYSAKSDSEDHPFPAPFDRDFYLILQLAVGGNFDGNPTAETEFPQALEIDYVRVYQ